MTPEDVAARIEKLDEALAGLNPYPAYVEMRKEIVALAEKVSGKVSVDEFHEIMLVGRRSYRSGISLHPDEVKAILGAVLGE